MKISLEEQKNGQALYQQLVEKAWVDTNFKNQLIVSPIDTIESFSNNQIEFKENVNIIVEDQTNNSMIYLNIPRKVNLDNMELTPEQLELVAGGLSFYDIGYAIGAAFRRVGGGGHGYYYTMY